MRFTINQHHMYELRDQLIQGCTTTYLPAGYYFFSFI